MRRRPLLTIATVLGFGVCIWMPLDRARDEQARIAALRGEEQALISELAELQETFLETTGPAMTEQLARRRLGMVKPGERAFVVATPAEPVERPEVVEPAADEPATPIWRRATSAVLRAVTFAVH